MRDRETAGAPEHKEPDPLPVVLSSETIYRGRVVSMRVDRIALPGGSVAVREVVEHPGAVVVVALDKDGGVYLVRQYRHPLGAYLLEFPAGCIEAGEEPLAAAQRELREEVGLEAREWTPLGSFFSSPGFASEHLYAFLARGLESVETDPDDDEDISVVRYPLTELLARPETAPDAKTLAACCLLDRIVGSSPETAT
jgi:ADP-ribose diphosphatase